MDDFTQILSLATSSPWLFLVVSFMVTLMTAIKFWMKKQTAKAQAIKDTLDMQKQVGEVTKDYVNTDRAALDKLNALDRL